MLLVRGPALSRAVDRGCAAAIGNFDGLHLGHEEILERLAASGRPRGLPLAVLTFEPQPKEYFTPEAAPARLMRLRDKVERLAALGIDRVVALRFGAALASWDAKAFVERILDRALGVRLVVVGEGFRFGRGRSGDVALLRREGTARGFDVEEVAPLEAGGERVSSTRIRTALAAGRLDEAAALLGRPYRISGRVVAGGRLGRRLGFPTANLRLHRRVSPVAGIFAVRVGGLGGPPRPAVASVGTRPTVGGREWLLEVYLFDYDGDLYGRRLDVDFFARLRDELRFADVDRMVAQMHEDARRARAALGA